MNTMSRNPKKLALYLFSQFHALSRKNVITADSGRFHELQTGFGRIRNPIQKID